MSPFHAGMLVVCVDDSGLAGWSCCTNGGIYTVAKVGMSCKQATLFIAEDRHNILGIGHYAERFRPAKLASKEVFDQLTAPFKRENAREDA